ncbi:MAG: fibronectin type III domain-containing protein [Candidatus Dojkabacteria bacterium]|jgi:hypothetical protein|nr:fibronectin type III domain-containing protein [Candidatus Dojkabacteria bacterium]
MNKKKILPLFSLLALLLVIPVAMAYFQRGGFNLRISALEEDEPTNIVISDTTGESFRVSWITQREVIGGILLSDGTRFSESDKTSYHVIDAVGLKPSMSYSFKILSDSKEFSSEAGGDYTHRTASLPKGTQKFLIYGQVFSPDGFSFQQGGVITMQLSNEVMTSDILSTTINETGGYQFDLGNILDKNNLRSFPYRTKSDATLVVFISHEDQPVSKQFTLDFSTNRQVPNIYLGEVNIDILPAIEGE